MQLIKKVFNFYLNASIHVALSAYALSWITLCNFNIAYDENVLYFVFYGAITAYNFVKYFGVAKFHHRRLTNRLKIIQLFSLISFVLLCYYATQLHLHSLLFIIFFIIITFLYAIPFLPKQWYLDSDHNLRNINGLKVYIVAFVWVGVTVFFPLINANFSFTLDVYITALQYFVFVIVLMLPFEIRDLKYDSIKLATIPQRIGVKYTKRLGFLLLVVFFFTEFFKTKYSLYTLIITLIVTILCVLFLLYCSKKRSFYYSAFWVESIPVFWLLIIMLSKFFV